MRGFLLLLIHKKEERNDLTPRVMLSLAQSQDDCQASTITEAEGIRLSMQTRHKKAVAV
jgi:hypothetical protein